MRNKLFIISIAMFIVAQFLTMIIRGQKDVSILENRTLSQFPFFTIEGFKTNNYQKAVEKAYADQFVLGETIKAEYNHFNAITRLPIYYTLRIYADNSQLMPKGKGVFELGNTRTLVYQPINNMSLLLEKLEARIMMINTLVRLNSAITFYLYKINRDVDILELDKIDNKFLNTVDGGVRYMSSSYIKDYDDYIKNYYKTDHHWNYLGSYKGYEDIIELMLGDEVILRPRHRECFSDIHFNGSKSRKIGDFSLYDDFCVYNFNIPIHTSKINGKERLYGRNIDYYEGNYEMSPGINHYARFYGGDVGELIFNFPQNNSKDNLLILSDSFSNAINVLIASHYNTTYIIDLRNYERDMGTEFILNEYVKDKNIKHILFLGNINFYTSSEFDFKIE